MTTYQPYLDFSAQGFTVGALMGLYARLRQDQTAAPVVAPIVVFAAFAIEAYLNSIGARKITFWDELERLPWKKKVEILHKQAGSKPDWGKEPLQFAKEVFEFRDKLAHGKPERVLGPVFNDANEAGRLQDLGKLRPDWYSRIDREWAEASQGRFRALMMYLAGLYALHESDHLLSSHGGIFIDDGGAESMR